MSDIEILKEIRSGNYGKFSLLYEKYFDRIYRYIYSKTYNRETCEDICSSTFMKALENMASFKGDGSKILSWIYTIARNQITDYYRKKSDESCVDDIWDLSSDENLEIDLINRESFDFLNRNLGSLKSLEREIITLHIWEELTFKEIALSLGLKEGKCKMVFYRSLKKMKSKMKDFIAVILSFNPLLLLGGQSEMAGYYE